MIVKRDRVTLISEVVDNALSAPRVEVEHLTNVVLSPIKHGRKLDREGSTSVNSATLFYFPEESMTDSPVGIPRFSEGKRIARGHLTPSQVQNAQTWLVQSYFEYFTNGEPHHIEVNLV